MMGFIARDAINYFPQRLTLSRRPPMQHNRRGFLTGLIAFAAAAPAIVHAKNLMPVRAPKLLNVYDNEWVGTLRVRLPNDYQVIDRPFDLAKDGMNQSDALRLDGYVERILKPRFEARCKEWRERVATAIMNGTGDGICSDSGLNTGLSWPE